MDPAKIQSHINNKRTYQRVLKRKRDNGNDKIVSCPSCKDLFVNKILKFSSADNRYKTLERCNKCS